MVNASGSGEARVARDALRALGFSGAWDVPVGTRLCEEPIVVTSGAWERESRQADGSVRGVRSLAVRVCRDDAFAAEATAREVARGLAAFDWAHPGFGLPDGLRVVACDVGQPVCAGRDGSCRWLWDVAVAMTVVVSDG